MNCRKILLYKKLFYYVFILFFVLSILIISIKSYKSFRIKNDILRFFSEFKFNNSIITKSEASIENIRRFRATGKENREADVIFTKLKSGGKLLPIYVFNEFTDMYISHDVHHTGAWDPTTTNILIKELHSMDGFIDIGANIGVFTLHAAHMGKYVIAVEPSQENTGL